MSEIASVGASTPAVAAPASVSCPSGGTSGMTVSASSSSTATSSQQITQSLDFTQISESSSFSMSEYTSQMMTIIMALIQTLFGQDDDDQKSQTGALMALMMLSQSFQSQSYQGSYQETSISMSSSISQQSMVSSASSVEMSTYGPEGNLNAVSGAAPAIGGTVNAVA